LLDELGGYRRELDKGGETTEKIHDKAKYHHLDALRYVVAGATHGVQPGAIRASGPGIYQSTRVKVDVRRPQGL